MGGGATLTLGRLDDRVLGRYFRGGDLNAVFVKLVVWRARGRGSGANVGDVDLDVTVPP